MYCAVIGDLVQSRDISIEERNNVQKNLISLLGDVNRRFAVHIAADFTVALGDEFQGLLGEAAVSLRVVDRIARGMHPYEMRFGIGIGDVRTNIDPHNTLAADGSAYHFARDAILGLENEENDRKKSSIRGGGNAGRAAPLYNIRYETGAADSALINLGCGVVQGIVRKWSDKQWQTICAVVDSGNRQSEAALLLKLDKSTVTRNLQAARYAEYLKITSTLESYLRDTYDTAATASVRLRQALNLIDSAGYFMRAEIDYDLALEKYLEALSIRKACIEGGDERVAESLDCVGDAYIKKGDGRAALPYYEEAAAMRKATGAEGAPAALSMYNIGRAKQKMGLYKDALRCFGDAAGVCENLWDSDRQNTADGHWKVAEAEVPLSQYAQSAARRTMPQVRDPRDMANAYFGLAEAHGLLGDYAQSLEWHERALDIREKALGSIHPDTADSYAGIAMCNMYTGQYQKALEWLNKALDISEKARGAGHPDTAEIYYGIGLIYDHLNDYDAAIEWHSKALAIRKNVLGEGHPETAASYIGIASVFANRREIAKALEWYSMANIIYKNTIGPDHPDMAMLYNNIAIVYILSDSFDNALEYCFKSLEINKNCFGPEHYCLAANYANIAGVYTEMGNYDLAMEWYKKAQNISAGALRGEHPDMARIYAGIAAVHGYEGRHAMEYELYKKALGINEKAFGREHPAIASNCAFIARSLYSMGMYGEALEWYLKAQSVFELTMGADHHDSLHVCHAIILTYNKLGMQEEANKWQSKLVDITAGKRTNIL